MAASEGVSGGAELRLEGLTKTYGTVVAVKDVTATIARGEFFSILGPSGSGKTTTLLMIAGFAFPTRGGILIDGKPVEGLAPQARGLGMVFQNYAVFPHLTVFENIAFPLRVRKVAGAEIARRVDEMLDLVRLPGYGGRLPRQLSGGEQQRVALARALVYRPPVLLMDEPLGALDKKLRSQMQLELRRIHRQLGVTVVYVTHDQEEALTMSDRVAVMNRGAIEQVGPPDGLYDQPENRFVADFFGESNFIDGEVVAHAGDGRVTIRAADGGLFHGTAARDVAIGAKVTGSIRPEKLVLAEGEARHAGVVREAIFSGDSTRYRVAVEGLGEVMVKLQNRLAVPRHAVGEPIALAWDPRELRVFARENITEGSPDR